MLFDELQIVYQAHSEVGSVSFIDCFQSAAWKALALETERDFTFRQLGTLLLEERTVLSSQPAAYAPCHLDTFCPQIMLQSQVARAECTIHSARCNQNLIRVQPCHSARALFFGQVNVYTQDLYELSDVNGDA
jgi:hypothetical protein